MSFHANEPVAYQTLEEQAYQRLRTGILNGEYAPGTRLVSTALAATLRVSRITVANALKRLSSEGFVTARPHREAVVATLDVDDLREIFLMRHALEDMVLLEAAHKVTAEGLADLRLLERNVRHSIEHNDVSSYRALEREFHLQVYAVSELRLITATLMDLWNRLEPYRSRRHTKLGLESSSIPERVAIISALERGDGVAAAQAMRIHVDHGYERILETMRAPGSGDAVPTERERHKDVFVAPSGSLVEALGELSDVRRAQGRLYPQNRALAIIVLAMLCGARSRAEISNWCTSCHPAIRSAVGLTGFAAPSGATVHRLLVQTTDSALLSVLRSWLDQVFAWDGNGETVAELIGNVRGHLLAETMPEFAERVLCGFDGVHAHRLAVREFVIALGCTSEG